MGDVGVQVGVDVEIEETVESFGDHIDRGGVGSELAKHFLLVPLFGALRRDLQVKTRIENEK